MHYLLWLISIIAFTWKIPLQIYQYFIGYFYPPDLTKLGKWAIITGANTGLGKAYAYNLASKGLQLVLLDRRESKLQELCMRLKEKYEITATYIPFDFCHGDYNNLKHQLQECGILINVGILINAVQFKDIDTFYRMSGSGFKSSFNDVYDRHMKTLKVNCLSKTLMSSIVLPTFYRRKEGLIINVSHVTGNIPSGCFSLYGAASIFSQYFTKIANLEAQIGNLKFARNGNSDQKHNIIIQNLTAAGIQNEDPYLEKNSEIKIPNSPKTLSKFLRPTAEKFVENSLKTAGYKKETCGYFWHSLFYGMVVPFLMVVLPESWIAYYSYNIIEGIRSERRRSSVRRQSGVVIGNNVGMAGMLPKVEE